MEHTETSDELQGRMTTGAREQQASEELLIEEADAKGEEGLRNTTMPAEMSSSLAISPPGQYGFDQRLLVNYSDTTGTFLKSSGRTDMRPAELSFNSK